MRVPDEHEQVGVATAPVPVPLLPLHDPQLEAVVEHVIH